jgi:WD40 repeat protein
VEVGSFLIDRQVPPYYGGSPPAFVMPMAFTLDGRRLAIESGNAVTVWDVTTRQVSRVLPAGASGPLAWAPDGRRLVTLFSTARAASGTLGGKVPLPTRNLAPEETTVKIWDADTGTELLTVQRGEGVQAILWDHGGERLFIGGRSGITVWDPKTATRFLTLNGDAQQLAWVPGGRDLVSIGKNGPQIWDTGGHDSSNSKR